MGRPCPHPHHCPDGWLTSIPTTPCKTGQVILTTEIGLVPYRGYNNERALAAGGSLIRRHLAAGTITDGALVPDSVRAWADGSPIPRYENPVYAVPQLVLAGALAEAEGRLCVADYCRQRLADLQRPRSSHQRTAVL